MMTLMRQGSGPPRSASGQRARRWAATAGLAAFACVAVLSQTHSADGAAAAVSPMEKSAPAGSTGLPEGFVRVKDGRFVIGPQCHEFFFAGWNQWEILELSANTPSPPYTRVTPLKGQQHVTNVLDDAVKNGLKVVRAWAHSITEGAELMDAPGVYDDKMLAALDWVMEELRVRGLRVVWVLADNWYPVGGIDGFVKMGNGGKHQDFFSNAQVKKIFQDHISFLLNRKNTINGRVYKDDPTIMAWNLANEARCTGCPSSVMQSWIEETCGFIKSIDPNHLIGIGYEGFYGPDSGKTNQNPGLGGSDWASKEGQDFLQNHKTPCIDYVGMHVWPDNWNFKSPDFQKAFIRSRIDEAAKSLPGKPVILEEFGKITEDSAQIVRNKYFQNAYEVAEESAKAGGPLMGTLFWHWYDIGVGPGKYGVHKTDSTFALIQAHAKVMNGLFDAGRKDICPS